MAPKNKPVRGQLPYVNTIKTTPASDNNMSGIGGNRSLEPPVNRYNTACETVYKGQNNCYIVLGRQRSGPPEENFGGQGHMNCAMIDLVSGLGSWTADTPGFQPESPPGTTALRNPNYFVDAARILISEKCNVDDDFALSGENIKEASAAAIKADSVRLISREGGIKLVTSGDMFNSRGGRMVSVAPIQFLAGNAPEEMLQPVVRGNNLKEAFFELMKLIRGLAGITTQFLIAQQEINNIVYKHDHVEVCSVAVGSGAGQPLALNGGNTGKSYGILKECIEPLLRIQIKTFKDLETLEAAFGKWKIQFLNESSDEFINSPHVETV